MQPLFVWLAAYNRGEYTHTSDMENVMKMMSSKRTPALVVGILMSLVSIVLYAVGLYSAARGGLWIASIAIAVVGMISAVVAAMSSNGWMRAISMIFVVVPTVFITIMATVYFL